MSTFEEQIAAIRAQASQNHLNAMMSIVQPQLTHRNVPNMLQPLAQPLTQPLAQPLTQPPNQTYQMTTYNCQQSHFDRSLAALREEMSAAHLEAMTAIAMRK